MLWSFQCQDARRAENVREHFLAFLHTFASATSDFAAAELIFGELVANVVRYAPGQVVIRVEWPDESPVLTVQDRGQGFEPKFELPEDPLAEGGRGLFLVATLGRQVDVVIAEGRGATVSVTLPVWRSEYTVA